MFKVDQNASFKLMKDYSYLLNIHFDSILSCVRGQFVATIVSLELGLLVIPATVTRRSPGGHPAVSTQDVSKSQNYAEPCMLPDQYLE